MPSSITDKHAEQKESKAQTVPASQTNRDSESQTDTKNSMHQNHKLSHSPRQREMANCRQSQTTEQTTETFNHRQTNRTDNRQRSSTTDRPAEQTTETFNHRPTTDRDLQPQTTEQTTHRDPDLKSKVTAPATTGEATLVPDRERQPDLQNNWHHDTQLH